MKSVASMTKLYGVLLSMSEVQQQIQQQDITQEQDSESISASCGCIE